MRDRVPLFAGLTLLALAVAIGSLLIGNGIRDRNRTDVITVTGSAKQRIVSDYVIWTASVTAQGETAAQAEARLRTWTDRIHAFLDEQGVERNELTVQPIATLAPGDTDENGDTIDVFRLTRSFEVRSSRVPGVAGLAEASSRLLARGIPIAADPPQYVYTKLPKLRPQLIRAAIKDAQLRAGVLVDATGSHLGKVRGVDVGVFQVTAPNSTDVSDYGTYDTSTLQKDVTGVVNVTFALG